MACGILRNLCPLHWQVDSQPLNHQGSPRSNIFWEHGHTHHPHVICGGFRTTMAELSGCHRDHPDSKALTIYIIWSITQKMCWPPGPLTWAGDLKGTFAVGLPLWIPGKTGSSRELGVFVFQKTQSPWMPTSDFPAQHKTVLSPLGNPFN